MNLKRFSKVINFSKLIIFRKESTAIWLLKVIGISSAFDFPHTSHKHKILLFYDTYQICDINNAYNLASYNRITLMSIFDVNINLRPVHIHICRHAS